MKNIYDILEGLNIPYEKIDHPAVFTSKEAHHHYKKEHGLPTKNLFLRNKKGDQHYLIFIDARKTVDLKKLRTELQENKLSFASPERLQKYLGLTPGSVSPFGLINDARHHVKVFVDEELLGEQKINCHPNDNNATLVLDAEDFKKFLTTTGNEVTYITIPQ